MKRADVVFSGMRPTGRLHIGHWWGALNNWVALQERYPCFFSVVDWHMLTTGYADTSALQDNVREMVLDWLAAGVDPKKCVIFKQSDVPEHAELALMLGMVTPLGWLENNPTWKEQLQELAKTKESQARLELDRRYVHRKKFENLLSEVISRQINEPDYELIESFYSGLSKNANDLIGYSDVAKWCQNLPESLESVSGSVSDVVIPRLALGDIAAEKFTAYIIKTLIELKKNRVIQQDVPADFLSIFKARTNEASIKFDDFVKHIHAIISRIPVETSRPADDPILKQVFRLWARNKKGLLGSIPVWEYEQYLQSVNGEAGANESLRTFGFLGYPVLQAADILLYHGTLVPVGQDQLPHLELSREIAHKFNRLFGEVFAEPRPLLTPTPKVPGLDARKMSKSYGNAVNIYEESGETLKKKVMSAYTDPTRKKATDPGHPEPCAENPPGCVVFALEKLYADEAFVQRRREECIAGRVGCVACKKDLLGYMEPSFDDFRRRRESYKASDVDAVLAEGAEKARAVARDTMDEVRRAMRLK